MCISPAGYRAVILMLFASGSVFFAASNGGGNVSASVAGAMDAGSDPAAMIFPQIADGGGNRTHLLLTNASATATVATISFFSESGLPLELTINGSTSSTFDVSIPAFGSAKMSTSGLPVSTLVGWANVTTNPTVDLNGNAVFQYFKDAQLFAEASVPGVLPISTLDFFADEEGGYKTGFALANAGTVIASGTLTLRRKDGTVFDTFPISLGPGEHIATFLFQIFGADAPSGRAELNLVSGALAATALRYHTSSLFSTLPVGQPGFAMAGAAALFSPKGGVRSRIIAEINRAQSTIDIAIYSFTGDAIRDALIDARDRGVQIRIIADTSQANGQGSEIATLEGLGFQLKRTAGVSGGIMHNKFMIIDGKMLLTGSYNWSASAEDSNFENAIFLQGSTVIQNYALEFDHIWNK